MAAANRVPRPVPRMSESRISTRLGGMIWPRVPDAQMVPQASDFEYPRRRNTGRVSRPKVTTVAPTMPVDAPMSTPTRMIESPMPPRRPPAAWPITSSSSSARRERSSITPMNTNSGIAIRIWLSTTPKMRIGSRLNSANSPPR